MLHIVEESPAPVAASPAIAGRKQVPTATAEAPAVELAAPSPKRARKAQPMTSRPKVPGFPAEVPAFKEGDRVRIRSPAQDPTLHSEEGRLVKFNDTSGRWKVALDSGEQWYVRANNLEKLAPPAAEEECPKKPAAPAADKQDKASVAVKTEVLDLETPDLLHVHRKLMDMVRWDEAPEAQALLARHVQEWRELLAGNSANAASASFAELEAHASVARTAAAADLEEAVEKTQVRVANLHDSVTKRLEQSAASLDAYQAMQPPNTYHEMVKRNMLRDDLWLSVNAVMDSLEQLHDVVVQPRQQWQSFEASTADQLHGFAHRLAKLKEAARQLSLEQQDKVLGMEGDARHLLVSLAPGVGRVDDFVRRCAREMAVEAQEGRGVKEEKLLQLRAEEARYVRANESLSRNQAFARVREEIECTEVLLGEHQQQQEERRESYERWGNLMDRMPLRGGLDQEADMAGQKRKWKFW